MSLFNNTLGNSQPEELWQYFPISTSDVLLTGPLGASSVELAAECWRRCGAGIFSCSRRSECVTGWWCWGRPAPERRASFTCSWRRWQTAALLTKRWEWTRRRSRRRRCSAVSTSPPTTGRTASSRHCGGALSRPRKVRRCLSSVLLLASTPGRPPKILLAGILFEKAPQYLTFFMDEFIYLFA